MSVLSQPTKAQPSVREWSERTKRALEAIKAWDCGQGFNREDWLALLDDALQEQSE